MDSDTKLVVLWRMRGNTDATALEFMKDSRSRIWGLKQLSSDGHKAQLEAV